MPRNQALCGLELSLLQIITQLGEDRPTLPQSGEQHPVRYYLDEDFKATFVEGMATIRWLDEVMLESTLQQRESIARWSDILSSITALPKVRVTPVPSTVCSLC